MAFNIRESVDNPGRAYFRHRIDRLVNEAGHITIAHVSLDQRTKLALGIAICATKHNVKNQNSVPDRPGRVRLGERPDRGSCTQA